MSDTLSFSLQYGRTFTEMKLTKEETSKAKTELYVLLEKVIKAHHNMKQEDKVENKVDIYEVSQRFSSDQLEAAFTSEDAQLLNGVLLKTVIELINKKSIFGFQNTGSLIDAEKVIFEIYDDYAQDFVVLSHLDSPVPNEAKLRLKLNSIQDVFAYEGVLLDEKKTEGDGGDKTNLVQSKEDSEINSFLSSSFSFSSPLSSPNEQNITNSVTEQSQTNSSSISSKVQSSENSLVENEQKSTFEDQGQKLAEESKQQLKIVQHSQQNRNNKYQKRFNQKNSTKKNSLPPLSRAQMLLFKDIFKALENENVLQDAERQASRLLIQMVNDKNSENPTENQNFTQNLIDYLWKLVVKEVAILPNSTDKTAVAPEPSYLKTQCQQLYHLVVCVRYRDALARTSSFLEASALFELFNYVHAKVLAPYYRFEDYFFSCNTGGQQQKYPSVNSTCICGICGLTTGAIIEARAAFCDNQGALEANEKSGEDDTENSK